MNMFWQHCQENKKLTFLACIPEQIYAASLEPSKNKNLFQNRRAYFRRILEISSTWFL